jgi:type I restriction enzyme S subunit
MSRTASVGFVAILGCTMATSQDFVNWICGPELEPWFLLQLLIACRVAIRELGSGAVHHTIYFPTVQAFSICLPPITEQRAIAEGLRHELAAVESASIAAEHQLSFISELPAALRGRAFGGEI